MLSFMREPRSIGEDSSVQKPPAASGSVPADGVQDSQEQRDGLTQQRMANGKSQMANGGGGEYLTVAAQNKNARRQERLLARKSRELSRRLLVLLASGAKCLTG